MSKNSRTRETDAITLKDEEAVKCVPVNSLLVLSDVSKSKAIDAGSLSGDDLRFDASQAGTSCHEETKRLAAASAEMGCDIITG